MISRIKKWMISTIKRGMISSFNYLSCHMSGSAGVKPVKCLLIAESNICIHTYINHLSHLCLKPTRINIPKTTFYVGSASLEFQNVVRG